MTTYPEQSELGKKSEYEFHYNPDKLFPISRQKNRETLGVRSTELPFYGFDIWNHYEVSWLNDKGKPVVAIAEIIYSCNTPDIIESKSMKLYFNSFNNTSFRDLATVQDTIKRDLESKLNGGPVIVHLKSLAKITEEKLYPRLDGIDIDELDVECTAYHTEPHFLVTSPEIVEETLCTNLLKSNCLVTSQPDWCSVQIAYKGNKINREGLLRYIVSFRNDNEFHEQCIEKIFMHIMQYCSPEKLTVYGRSTRRGGIDINSIRSTHSVDPKKVPNVRLCRQ
jgi:7-cyano-7-deazaguanine reductase